MRQKKLWWTPVIHQFQSNHNYFTKHPAYQIQLRPRVHDYDDQLLLILLRPLPPTVSPTWPENHRQFASVNIGSDHDNERVA
jgi:hypothetical protein